MDLLSRPSDGHDLPLSLSIERPVASTFGVRIDLPATQPAAPHAVDSTLAH